MSPEHDKRLSRIRESELARRHRRSPSNALASSEVSSDERGLIARAEDPLCCCEAVG